MRGPFLLICCVLVLLEISISTASSIQLGSGNPSARTQAFETAQAATWGVAIVRVDAKDNMVGISLVGSGFFVSPRLFVTAEHVINPEPPQTPRSPRDQIRIYQTDSASSEVIFKESLRVLFADRTVDAAVLAPSTFRARKWFTPTFVRPPIGSPIGLFGYPLAEIRGTKEKPVVESPALGRAGTIAGYASEPSGVSRVLTAQTSNPGNSGGPEFMLDSGEAFSIHKAQLLTPSGKDVVGYSVGTPLLAIREILEKLEKEEKP